MTHYTLAFDTSANSVSIALLNEQTVIAESHQWMERGQGEALIPMIIALLDQAHKTMADINRIAVSVGPGSFTGVRVGLAAARGMGLALQIPVCGITTLQAAAFQTTGRVLSVFDTKRGDYYTQLFLDGNPVEDPTIRTSADMKALSFDKLAGPEDEILSAEIGKSYVADHPALAVAVGCMAEIAPRAPDPVYLRDADVSC